MPKITKIVLVFKASCVYARAVNMDIIKTVERKAIRPVDFEKIIGMKQGSITKLKNKIKKEGLEKDKEKMKMYEDAYIFRKLME